MTTLPKRTGPAALADRMRRLRTKPDARRLWRALVDQKGSYPAAQKTWQAARDLVAGDGPTRVLWRVDSVSTAEPMKGRPPVGEPVRHIRATGGRGPRKATPHIQVRLGPTQPEEVRTEAARRVMSGNAYLRASIDGLISGRIPPPESVEQIPPALPSVDEWPLVPGVGQLDALDAMGTALRDVLIPNGTALPGPRGGRRGKPETECRDALIRYAVAKNLQSFSTLQQSDVEKLRAAIGYNPTWADGDDE